MITTPEPDTEAQPLALDLLAVDLTHYTDHQGNDTVLMRLIDQTGLVIDCPMPRAKAALFGLSLADYAGE